MDQLEIFKKNIHELLAERGWSQNRLAAESGLTSAAISNYLTGKHNPQMNALIQIASAFGVSVMRLLSGPDDNVSEIVRTIRVKPEPLEMVEMLRKEMHAWTRIPIDIRVHLARVHAADWERFKPLIEEFLTDSRSAAATATMKKKK